MKPDIKGAVIRRAAALTPRNRRPSMQPDQSGWRRVTPEDIAQLQAETRAEAHAWIDAYQDETDAKLLGQPRPPELPLALFTRFMEELRVDLIATRAESHAQIDNLLDASEAAFERDSSGAAQH